MVLEVYGWLTSATSGYNRNRTRDALLLRRHRGNREISPGEWVAGEDHERVLGAVIQAEQPDQELAWPALLEGVAVRRVTDAEANVWLPWALPAALIHWHYRPRNPQPPQPEPPQKQQCS